MDKTEFARWAMALKTYFPRDNLLPTKESMELWFAELQDIPYNVALAMLRKWVNTQKWPPSISEIRSMCAEIVNGKLPEWSDGWQEVVAAIGRHGYANQDEALAAMSPITRDAVEKIGWRNICLSENPDTIRAQFRQCFQICAARQAEDRQINPELKAAITDLLDKANTQLLPESR